MRKQLDRPRLVEEICSDIANGVSLRQACDKEGRPDKTSFLRWVAESDEYRHQYVRAREAQADFMAEEILEIADDGTNDFMIRSRGDDEAEVVNHENIARSRLRVDARKWLMSKMAPKKYGERLSLDGDGEGGPIKLDSVVEVRLVRPER